MSGDYGKYVLQRKLAEGGMAELFLARQQGVEGFEKLVVVKRILPQLCSDDSFVSMFLNEARVAARLNHPNIVQIFDLGKLESSRPSTSPSAQGRLDRQYFIAMEYVHGEDLRTVIREAGETQRPSLGLACRMVADMLAGLHYAHTRSGPDGKPLGLVHRDVSPQNVIVTYDGSIKIVDFGIAKATREVGAAQTQAGLLKGKYSYMSPEQARGAGIDARADVFCAGILLWELATWTRLFKRPTEMATLMAVIEERIPSPRDVDAAVPADLDALINKALAREPNQRFASAQEMRAALEALIRKHGWEADSLALEQYMRGLFAGKLEAQAADVAAAGVASLEDFLLQVEEKTSISWMEVPHEKKTPSSGLPMTPPFGSPHIREDEAETPRAPVKTTAPRLPAVTAHDTFDDGPTTKAPEHVLAAAIASSRPPPAVPLSRPKSGPQPATKTPSGPNPRVPRPTSGPQFAVPESQLATVRSQTSPHNETAASAAPPPATSDPEHITLRPMLPDPSPLVASPTAATRGAVLPPPLEPEATRISEPASSTRATSPQPVWVPPSRWRRVLVAGSAAVAVGTIALTIALWPSPDPPPPLVNPNVGPNAQATIIIDVDAPADIAVDGKKQPRGQTATVSVQPGIEHEVTVESAGHAARRVHVPALAPGEHMPLRVKL